VSPSQFAPLLDAVRGLRWPARRRVTGTLPGAHRAQLRSPGGEFSEYRAYRQGDDPRRLDWRLLARSDRAYVRLADDHALLPTVAVVDASASMAFPAAGDARWAKWRQAAALAVGLLAVAHGAGDPVGAAVAAADGARALAPRSRRGAVLDAAALLAAVEPAGALPLAPLVGRVPAGCRLVVVSDFLGDAGPALAAAAAHAAAGGDVYAVHVVAADELDVPAGIGVAEDPEDPRVRRPLDAAGRRAYGRAFAEWRAELARAWRDAGTSYALVRDDEPPAWAVRRVVRGDAAAEVGSDAAAELAARGGPGGVGA
jgi:uncharacterized protein (DUF58 family)